MGILHKDCPRCATTVATYISRCECGFSFDGHEDADPAARLEALIEEERLYEEYLAARAKQAIAAAADAETAMFEEPDLYYKSTDAEKAIATRDAVLAELNQQKLRTAEILAAIEAVKTGIRKVHVLKPHAPKHPEQKPLEPAPAVSASKTTAKPRVTAPPAVIPPTTARPEPAVSVDPPRAKADDTSSYTAKLEEILMGAKRNEAPEPVADAVPLLLPAPHAPARAAGDRPVEKTADIVALPEAAVPASRSAMPPPSLSPEEALELAAKSVRSRATEMATRHGVASAHTVARASVSDNKAQSMTAAMPNPAVASSPGTAARTTDAMPTVVADPVEVAASAVTNSPVTPKNPAAPADARQQTRTRHARTAKSQRSKRDRQPTTQVMTTAPSGPAPATPEPFISDHPSAVFRTAQAAKAEKIVQAARTKKAAGPNHCPYCSATHPPETARCGCGYLFEQSFELPELVLNAKERAELFEGTYQIKRPKPPG